MRSEFSLIDLFTRSFRPPRAPVGPGDDCAVLPRGRGELCVTTDAVVEGIHFTLDAFRLEDVGHKALAVNLSDLAAMGARPRWF
ncbi:MAG: thiamine-phosphate kinase, partial [Rhodospirillales bacterium]|nr:thiamine-phosphate kinase [Rhodospirillales bacterium]